MRRPELAQGQLALLRVLNQHDRLPLVPIGYQRRPRPDHPEDDANEANSREKPAILCEREVRAGKHTPARDVLPSLRWMLWRVWRARRIRTVCQRITRI